MPKKAKRTLQHLGSNDLDRSAGDLISGRCLADLGDHVQTRFDLAKHGVLGLRQIVSPEVLFVVENFPNW
jgi:hypothetical protein